MDTIPYWTLLKFSSRLQDIPSRSAVRLTLLGISPFPLSNQFYVSWTRSIQLPATFFIVDSSCRWLSSISMFIPIFDVAVYERNAKVHFGFESIQLKQYLTK